MKTYLFDFDGTLVDSMPYYIKGVLKFLDDNKIKYDEDIIKTVTPLGFGGTADYFIRRFGLKISESQIAEEIKNNMAFDYFYRIPAKNNVISVLKTLKTQGASLNVLTASPHVTLDACLKRIGIFDLFDNVWSCDDFSTTKVDSDIYKKAAEKLNVEIGDILFLDDNYNADKAAKSAGVQVCGVFDISSGNCVNDIKEVADFYIYDFSELLKISY